VLALLKSQSAALQGLQRRFGIQIDYQERQRLCSLEALELRFDSQSTSTSSLARPALADSRARRWLAVGEGRTQERLKSKGIWGKWCLQFPEIWQRLIKWKGLENKASIAEDDITPQPTLNWAPQLVTLQHPFIAEGD
jgi:hypothetical protein